MIVEVKLNDETLGSIEWNDNKGSSTFQYSTEALIRRIEPSPVIMPVQERIFETNRDHINFHNLPYLLSDSMPDDFGHMMMKEWLRQKKLSIDDINPVDRLTYVGKRGMGALAGIDYKILRVSSYEALFRVMKRLSLPYYQFEQQYRRALFNVIARNHDDHVKNFSFLMDKDGEWKISPAYDITFQYQAGGTWTDVHQSSINGKFDHFTRDDLLGLGKTFGIKKANHVLEEVITAVNQWSKVATEIDIPKKEIEYISNNLRVNVK